MNLTLRGRILLTLLPLIVLLTALGTAAALLLYDLSERIDAILKNNYRSVLYMEGMAEAVHRIDASFPLALAGYEAGAKEGFDKSWREFDKWLKEEKDNITEVGEPEFVKELIGASSQYRLRGDAFFALDSGDPNRARAYFDKDGLQSHFNRVQDLTHQILRLNQQSMVDASGQARATSGRSLAWLGICLTVTVILALFAIWRTVRTVIAPIKVMTDAALGISAGNLDQVVPVVSKDELGQLGQTFNTMARNLRDYRQSHSAQLLRAQRTSQATIDSFPDPVLVLDSEGSVEMANPAARRMLGVLADLDHKNGRAAWQPPDALKQPLLEALRGQRNFLPEGFDRTVLFSLNGREHTLLPRILTIHDPYGNILGAAVLLQDVTRLRLLDQVKNNLVATASHELKTPLTSIRLAVHMLLEESVGTLNPKQTELLLDARENSERLLTMINNLLDLARLEQGQRQFDVHPERPQEVLENAANTVRPRAQDKGVDIVVEAAATLPMIEVDAVRLGNALRNLLDNALTYTDRGGRITLAARPDGDSVMISVSDTGKGIPPEFLPHVFEKFFRVPGQSRGGGTGLGLAIVQEIVTGHGGTISCESHAGQGTTFHIRLPALAEAMA